MNRIDQWLKQNFKTAYLLMILVTVLCYGILSQYNLIWADEAYTFALIRHSFAEVWQITSADVHPPLFHFLLKLVTAPFGYNLAVCRFVVSIPCILIMAIGGWQLRKLFNERTAVLFMLLYLMFPFLMDYATEVRMYSLGELMVFLNALYGYRCWMNNKPKDWALFAVFGTCAGLTHYFALVSAAMVYGLLFLLAVFKNRKLLKNWFFAAIGTIVLYLPWLACMISQLAFKVTNEYWIAPITFGTIVNYVITLFSTGAMETFPLFFGLAYLVAFVALLLSRDKKGISVCLFALAVPLGTVAVGLAASFLVRPVFVIRYIVPSLPLAVFFFAYVLGNTKNEFLLSSLLTVAIIGGISNLVFTVKHILITTPTRISPAMVESFPEYDAFVSYSGNTLHISQELSYYDPVTPIYTQNELFGADNPYPNRVPIDQFQAEENDSVILVLEGGASIPEEFSGYTAEKLAFVYVSGSPTDIWHLSAETE